MIAKGVQSVPPPLKLIPDLTASIAAAMIALGPGKRFGLVAVGTYDEGQQPEFNLAVAWKPGDSDHWKIGGWVGSKWGEKIGGGVAVQVAY